MKPVTFDPNKLHGRKQKVWNADDKFMTETLAGTNRAIRAHIVKMSEMDDQSTKITTDAKPTDADSLIAS